MAKEYIDHITRENILKALEPLDPMRTKIYIGCDSERFIHNGVPHADYAVVVVIHKNGNQGCKLFGDVHRERDYDQKEKPAMRLMNEVYKAAEVYNEYKDIFCDWETEIHLDLNPNDEFKSAKMVAQAIGYIKGVCNITPKVKSSAPAASFAADRFKQIREDHFVLKVS